MECPFCHVVRYSRDWSKRQWNEDWPHGSPFVMVDGWPRNCCNACADEKGSYFRATPAETERGSQRDAKGSATGETMLPVVVFSRSGRHRSVAAAEILKYAFVRLKWYKFAPTMHITIDEEGAGCRCPDCERHRPVGESIEKSVASAVALLRRIALEEFVALQAASSASPPAVPSAAAGRRECVCAATWRGRFCQKCGTQH